MVSIFFSLPKGGAGARPEVKKELAVLMRPQVLSALLTTVLGAGAMFTLYTYISSRYCKVSTQHRCSSRQCWC